MYKISYQKKVKNSRPCKDFVLIERHWYRSYAAGDYRNNTGSSFHPGAQLLN